MFQLCSRIFAIEDFIIPLSNHLFIFGAVTYSNDFTMQGFSLAVSGMIIPPTVLQLVREVQALCLYNGLMFATL